MNNPIPHLISRLPASDIYPAGVVTPIIPSILGRSFFPGGSGRWGADSPPLPSRPIMLVGQDFGTLEYWNEIKAARDESLDGTWGSLIRLLDRAHIDPHACFFTNALLGVRNVGPIEGPSPGLRDSVYVEASLEHLCEQIRTITPSVVVALGVVPSVLLSNLFARTRELLHGNARDPGAATWAEIDSAKLQVVDEVAVTGAPPFRFVTSVHPSRFWLNMKRRAWLDRGVIGEAAHDLIWSCITDAANREIPPSEPCGRLPQMRQFRNHFPNRAQICLSSSPFRSNFQFCAISLQPLPRPNLPCVSKSRRWPENQRTKTSLCAQRRICALAPPPYREYHFFWSRDMSIAITSPHTSQSASGLVPANAPLPDTQGSFNQVLILLFESNLSIPRIAEKLNLPVPEVVRILKSEDTRSIMADLIALENSRAEFLRVCTRSAALRTHLAICTPGDEIHSRYPKALETARKAAEAALKYTAIPAQHSDRAKPRAQQDVATPLPPPSPRPLPAPVPIQAASSDPPRSLMAQPAPDSAMTRDVSRQFWSQSLGATSGSPRGNPNLTPSSPIAISPRSIADSASAPPRPR